MAVTRTPPSVVRRLAWRLPIGIGVAAAVVVAGATWPVGLAAGVAVVVPLMFASLPRPAPRASFDPFSVGEPWRHFVHGAQRAARRLHDTVGATPPGPLRERLESIAARLDDGLHDTYRIARRGDEIDAAVARLDPSALRSKLATLTARAADEPSADVAQAIASVESQLAGAERLRRQSTQAADRLRLAEVRLDELVARAAEVSVGAGDSEAYGSDVDDLVVELESLRLALEDVSNP